MSSELIRHTAIADDGCEIEYFSNEVASDKTPVIVSMGNWEPAFRAFPILRGIKDRTAYALSYRGRGGSDSPKTGYDWKDHASDLASVIADAGLEKAYFVAFSRGVSYTLGYLNDHPDSAKGLILVDYPAQHSQVSKGYAQFWATLRYREYKLSEHISAIALDGIERESTAMDFYPLIAKAKFPISVFAGRNRQAPIESNLSDQDATRYLAANERIELIGFEHSGHMIFDDEAEKAMLTINTLLDRYDRGIARGCPPGVS